ncbi:hypothetical protein EJ06DRAFT_11488 [Trichodelitschia bisporula]|uniref:Uncharacterized protein n=1 Tax=Trichodelitschia bisporula TaxID=703511 RepID=A0A6G1IAK6_9PEZI|nr:hypothetical protein EJ06DRAFT_11488 [Trichodelitschia bisporula]
MLTYITGYIRSLNVPFHPQTTLFRSIHTLHTAFKMSNVSEKSGPAPNDQPLDAAGPPYKDIFLFLALPLELRWMVYRQALFPKGEVAQEPWDSAPELALLWVNQQVQDEARDLMYKEATYVTKIRDTASHVSPAEKVALRNFRSIKISWEITPVMDSNKGFPFFEDLIAILASREERANVDIEVPNWPGLLCNCQFCYMVTPGLFSDFVDDAIHTLRCHLEDTTFPRPSLAWTEGPEPPLKLPGNPYDHRPGPNYPYHRLRIIDDDDKDKIVTVRWYLGPSGPRRTLPTHNSPEFMAWLSGLPTMVVQT